MGGYRFIKRRHWHFRLPLAVAVLVVSCALAFLLELLFLAFPGILACYLILRLDLDYYRLKEEALWYGIER